MAATTQAGFIDLPPEMVRKLCKKMSIDDIIRFRKTHYMAAAVCADVLEKKLRKQRQQRQAEYKRGPRAAIGAAIQRYPQELLRFPGRPRAAASDAEAETLYYLPAAGWTDQELDKLAIQDAPRLLLTEKLLTKLRIRGFLCWYCNNPKTIGRALDNLWAALRAARDNPQEAGLTDAEIKRLSGPGTAELDEAPSETPNHPAFNAQLRELRRRIVAGVK